jgi:integrase
VSQLSVLFNEAIDNWGHDKLVKPRIVRSKVAEGRQRRFTSEEVAEAIERLEKSPKELYADVADLIRVLADTGMRLNEALKLTRANFNLTERQIVLWVTKNKQPRGVPMTPRVLDVLTARAHLSKPFGMLSETMATRAWKWVRGEMGFAEDKEFVMHTLRHTVGSRLADANVSAPLIQQMLGHKSLRTTQKYIHVSAAGLRGVADILAADGSSAVAKTAAKVAPNGHQKVSPDESEEAA